MAKSFLGILIRGSIKLAKIAAREAAIARKEKLKEQRAAERLRLKIEKENERLRKIEDKKINKNNITKIK